MAVNTNTIVSNVYAQNYTPGSKEKTKVARNTETGEVKKEEKVTESKDLGKTIGDPKLSKEAQKYYEKLKKKYGNYDFILVSKDQKANAQANAAKYAKGENPKPLPAMCDMSARPYMLKTTILQNQEAMAVVADRAAVELEIIID